MCTSRSMGTNKEINNELRQVEDCKRRFDGSIIVAALTVYLLFPGLDVCSPVQEDLDGLQVVKLSSH